MSKYETPAADMISLETKEVVAADHYEEVDFSQMISKEIKP